MRGSKRGFLRGLRGWGFALWVAISYFCSGGHATAQFTDWVPTGTSDWSDSANWTGGVPGSSFSGGRINNGGTAQIDSIAAVTDFGLTVGNTGSGFLEITGGGALLNRTNPYLLPSDVIIGSGSSSNGSALIDGSGSLWDIDARFYLGWNGQGSIDITDGGELNSSAEAYLGLAGAGDATMTIDGSGSKWITSGSTIIGSGGTAYIDVSNGGSFTSNGLLTFGDASDGEGGLTITGSASQWDATSLATFGFGGAGTLSVEDGATANLAGLDAAQASDAAASIIVSGAGSTIATGALNLGIGGEAVFEIGAGGWATSDEVVMARDSGSTAEAIVDGSGSGWQTGALTLANNGDAYLEVVDGGSLEVATLTAGKGLGSTGELLISGSDSSLDVSGAVVVGDAGTATFTFGDGTQSSLAGTLTLGAQSTGDGTVAISDAATAVTVNGATVVGQSGSGVLSIDGGANLSGSPVTTLADGSGSTGEVTVDGADSQWNAGDLTVGGAGSGSVVVSAGAAVDSGAAELGVNSSGDGAIEVNGIGAAWTSGSASFGVEGNGELAVLNGATALLSGNADLGIGLFASGKWTVDGGGSVLTTSSVIAGDFGASEIDILNGAGLLSSGDFVLANGIGSLSSAQLNGVGSHWEISDELIVGNGGVAVLDIEAGATLSVGGGAAIANQPSATGTVNVNGAGSVLDVTGGLEIGPSSGEGSLVINGGNSYVTETVLIGEDSRVELISGILEAGQIDLQSGGELLWTAGTIAVTGAPGVQIGTDGPFGDNLSVGTGQNLSVTETLTIDSGAQFTGNGSVLSAGAVVNDGQFDYADGTLHLGAGGFTNNNQATLSNTTIAGSVNNPVGSTLDLDGTVTFAGPLNGAGDIGGGGVAQVNDVHSPGGSPAAVNIDGDLSYGAEASVTFEIGGETAGSEYDQLLVSGDVNLDGTLNVTLINGFVLGADMNFVVIETGRFLSGTFDGLSEGSVVGNYGGEDLFVSYTGGDVRLFTAIPEPGVVLLLLSSFWLGLARRRRT